MMGFGSTPSVKDEVKWKKAIQRRLLDSGHDASSIRLFAIITCVSVLLITSIVAINYWDDANNSFLKSIIGFKDMPAANNIAVVAKSNPKLSEADIDALVKSQVDVERTLSGENSEDNRGQTIGEDLPVTQHNQNVDDDIQIAFQKASSSAPIVLFSKTFCPFCTEIKKILLPYNKNADGEKVVSVIELDRDPEGRLLLDGIEQIVGRRSVPQTFVSGEFFGGLRAVKDAEESGELAKLVDAARLTFKTSNAALEQ